jgi:hypothetical protein
MWCRREAQRRAYERLAAAGGTDEPIGASAVQPHDEMTLFHDQWGFGTQWCLCIFTHSVRTSLLHVNTSAYLSLFSQAPRFMLPNPSFVIGSRALAGQSQITFNVFSNFTLLSGCRCLHH